MEATMLYGRPGTTPYCSSRQMSRALTEEFIRAYRSFTCLWKIRSPEYMNKELKNDAYARLEEICRKERPEAGREFVVKKINSLRGSFRREYRRVITGHNYVPQLWFYDLLSFTADQDNELSALGGYSSGGDVPSSNNGFSYEDEGYGSYYMEEDEMKKFYATDGKEIISLTEETVYDLRSTSPQVQQSPLDALKEHKDSLSQENATTSPEASTKQQKAIEIPEAEVIVNGSSSENLTNEAQQRRPSHRRKIQQNRRSQTSPLSSNGQQIFHLPSYQLNQSMTPSGFDAGCDEYTAFGITVASKLKQMDLHQRLFAENIINQTLLKGMLKCLKPPKDLVVDYDSAATLALSHVKQEILDDSG